MSCYIEYQMKFNARPSKITLGSGNGETLTCQKRLLKNRCK